LLILSRGQFAILILKMNAKIVVQLQAAEAIDVTAKE
jgi:hypothetical protein